MIGRVLYWRLASLALVVLLALSLRDLGLLETERLSRGWHNLSMFAGDMVPPDSGVLPQVIRALFETVEIAFAGTMLGFLIALPLALLATRSLVAPWVTLPVKLVLAFIRTVPALVWALVFVVAVGLGPAAGTLAVALYTIGYLGKLFYEQFESVDLEVMEAVRSVGASRMALARFAILPESTNGIISQLMFMFEYNVRASSIMGFVGAGGIGYYLSGYVQSLEYPALLTTVLVLFVAVVVLDRISSLLRDALR